MGKVIVSREFSQTYIAQSVRRMVVTLSKVAAALSIALSTDRPLLVPRFLDRVLARKQRYHSPGIPIVPSHLTRLWNVERRAHGVFWRNGPSLSTKEIIAQYVMSSGGICWRLSIGSHLSLLDCRYPWPYFTAQF